MKTRNVSILALGVAFFTVVITLQFSTGGMWLESKSRPKPTKNFVVRFKVAEDLKGLQIISPDCGREKNWGCLKVRKGHAGVVKFVFEAGDDWQLNKFQICKGNSKSKSVCSLNLWERLDFFVADDESGSKIFTAGRNGVIDLQALPAGSTEFFVLDQNTIKGEYFYSIEACSGGTCISTDPPMENKGRI